MDHRQHDADDRRANRRGGRRETDHGRPWYVRHRLWLATASLLFVGWRRVKSMTKNP
jgi:hypothetical protein